MKSKWIILLTAFAFSFSAIGQNDCTLSYASRVKYQELSNKLRIAYLEEGKGKQTLLMIHGLGGNLSHWDRNIPELSKKNRVIAIDLPNYGMSSPQKPGDQEGILKHYSAVIHEFIRKKKLKRVVLVGHSMGGQTALLTALDYPELVRKLVLAAPAGIETFTEQEAQLLISFVNPAVSRAQNETAVRQSFQMNFVNMPEEAETLIRDRLKMPGCEEFDPYWEGIAQGVKGMLTNTVFQRLSAVRQPVLIVFGAKDALIPNKYLHPALSTEKVAESAKENIKGSRMALIPEAGHMLMFEKPGEFNQILINFINN